MTCVDLRATFGTQLRYQWDDAYAAERPEFRAHEAPWLTLIPCRHGKIFPWGGNRLAGHCTGGLPRRRALAALPGTRIVQGAVRGCPEIVVLFGVDQIEAVAELLQARRPRQLSPEQRAALAARMRTWNARQRGPIREQDSTIAPGEALEPVPAVGGECG
jgi:hypothetical protein